MPVYRILDDSAQVIARILATPEFVQANYPGHYAIEPPDQKAIDRAAILAQLAAIDDATSKPRTVRELTLNNVATKAWLKDQDDSATALRAQLTALG